MKRTKFKAFTLAEMIVVLVVSSIVISMSFLVLNMVRKQVSLIQINYSKKQEVQLFEATFMRDFNSYSAFYDKKKEQLILKNSKDSITYLFLENLIIRQKDTIQIEVVNKKLLLDGVEVKEQHIDAIEIKLSPQFSGKQLFVHQTKDASYYLNN
ncbi:prepilin-type N-terminal cleavage/methylation domain-containing protein [Polaribacter sp. Asnod1-A03]|uniref:prepilin-type N-terminal cleavage/methylation domain-containing protein n=1 Tax=Polaribacter sp. Asnod1-A03 TaxID=3160581 RepID=UPI00386451BA